MQETRKRWSLEFKICAVTLSKQYKSVHHVAQELGVSKNSLQYWKKLYNDGKLALQISSDSYTNRKELLRLKKEIKTSNWNRIFSKKVLDILRRKDEYVINSLGKTLINFHYSRCANFQSRSKLLL